MWTDPTLEEPAVQLGRGELPPANTPSHSGSPRFSIRHGEPAMILKHSGPSASVLETKPHLDSRQERRVIESRDFEPRCLGLGLGTPLMSCVTYPYVTRICPLLCEMGGLT